MFEIGSNLNLRAPEFGQEGEIAPIAATTETTERGRGGGAHGPQIGGILAPMAVPVCILSTWVWTNYLVKISHNLVQKIGTKYWPKLLYFG